MRASARARPAGAYEQGDRLAWGLFLRAACSPLSGSRDFFGRSVLQRDQPIAIWGTPTPARGSASSSRRCSGNPADAKGAWRVVLPARATAVGGSDLGGDGKEPAELPRCVGGRCLVGSGLSTSEFTVRARRLRAEILGRRFPTNSSDQDQPATRRTPRDLFFREGLAGSDAERVGFFTGRGVFSSRARFTCARRSSAS